MTNERMALLELLEKGADADLILASCWPTLRIPMMSAGHSDVMSATVFRSKSAGRSD